MRNLVDVDAEVPLTQGSILNRPRLLMADGHTMFLEGIGKLLENECDLIGTVENGHALLGAAQLLRPNLILTDTHMPLLNGIEACRLLTKLMPMVRVIFLTMHADLEYVKEALHAGGSGYLLKRSTGAELRAAIKAVMRGSQYVTPLIDWKGSTGGLDPLHIAGRPLKPLTRRQREVLQLVAEGRANKEIATFLHVSEKTVDYHKSCLKRSLKLESTAELTQFAIKHNIISI
jgi:DNA-binding NarL/FixJ family response regulator